MSFYGEDQPTSYFSAPAPTLDPKLFQGRQLQSWVRKGILSLLHDFLSQEYRHSDLWAHPWLAGSGVSYQWSADRHPSDLDCLVGINFVQFRKANPEFRGLSDNEIAAEINDGFHNELQVQTTDWNGFELTFYVNPTATDIRAIKPYAAYDLKYDEWTVTPDPTQEAPQNAAWEAVVSNDYSATKQVHNRFTAALMDLQTSQGGPSQRNSEVRLHAAASQALAMYEEIHGSRGEAFSNTGEGYADFHNYRWQGGKRTGTVNLLRQIRDHIKQLPGTNYGVELPDTATLIRRAALHSRNI
jgi:hypothetical protein